MKTQTETTKKMRHPMLASRMDEHGRCSHKRCAVCWPVPRHRAEPWLPDENQSRARCTGGLTSVDGRRLTNCRSAVCPRHKPASYSSHMAKHTPESFK